MIPKIIHYCWFGKKTKPKKVLDYLETWKRFLPDYQIKEWNEKNFCYKKRRYTREAYHIGKYAFVSDVCRLHALYEEGGIYLDTDIEVLKSFDKFLHHKSFVGYEVNDIIGTGVIGAEKGTKWIGEMLSTYDSKEGFISWDGSLYNKPNTLRITNLLIKLPKESWPTVYPLDYFCAKHWKTKELFTSANTVCIHHYQSSWFNNPVKTDIYEQRFCAKFEIKNYHILTKLYKKYIAFLALF